MKFKKIYSKFGFTSVLTGTRNFAIVAINEAGEFGFLPQENKPYMPIGGRYALKSIKEILIYRPYKFNYETSNAG
jgi:hypothetical protein